MANNIELKLKLLSEFHTLDNPIGFCRQAYSFLMEDDSKHSQIPLQPNRQDGIYLIYEDGSEELFNGQNKLDGAVNIAFKFGPVALKLHSEDTACAFEYEGKDNEGKRVIDYDIAVNDYTGAENTADMLNHGLNVKLPKDMFIPSLGQLYMMYPLKGRLNKALEYIGHEPIETISYWSSTRYSTYLLWYLDFKLGTFSYYLYKTNRTFRVRPVSMF